MPDLVIRNALHDRTGQHVDVAVTGGVITAIAPDGVGPGDREIDAADAMVSPALIESHFHLENALLWDGAINQSGTLDEAIRQRGHQARPDAGRHPAAGIPGAAGRARQRRAVDAQPRRYRPGGWRGAS